MARMIPPLVAADVPKGERQLFAKLRDDPRTRDWIVFHSFDIRRHVVRSEGEADVLIVVPDQGVLCVEVKGCDVSRRDGLWIYSYSPPRTTPVGPFRQASEASHSIRNYLRSKDSSLAALMYYSAVVFTEIDFIEKSLEWEPWQVIGRTEFLRLPISSLVSRIFDHAHSQCRNRNPVPLWYGERSSRPTVKQAESVLRLLRSDFEYVGSLRSDVEHAEVAIRRFTEEQFDAIDHIVDNRRVIFKGPAGTGKTFLAVEAARRAVRERRSTVLLCFNNLLSHWLRRETEAIAVEARASGVSFYAGNLSSLMLGVAAVQVPQGASAKYWDDELPSLAVDAMLSDDRDTPTYAFLVVDEAQDLLTDSFLDVIGLLVEGGLDGGRWALFGDFERQAIYAGADTETGLERLRERSGGGVSSFRLRINCRNSTRIAEAVTITSGLSPGYSRVLSDVESPDVEPAFYRSAAHQKELLQAAIARLLRTFPPEQIVVLSTRQDSSACASQIGDSVGGFRVAPLRGEAGDLGAVRYASIHSFKGLEAAAVVLTDIEQIADDQAKALLYVGMSRARIQLHVLISERLRGAYDALLDAGLKAALRKGN